MSAQAALGLTKSFGYDRAGRVVGVSLPTGATQSFAYDDRSLMVGASGAAGNMVSTFNADRQIATRTDDAGSAVFAYDTLGRVAATGDASTGQTLTYAYNTAGQITRIDYGTPGATTPYRTYGYDSIGRRVSDVVKVNTTTRYDAAYSFDGNDNVVTETVKNLWGASSSDETYTYTYDWSNRLGSDSRKIGSGTPTVTNYSYDDAGNRTTAGAKTWTYDQRGRITCGPDGTYTWDPRGTLDRTTNASNIVVDYSFDGHGRLTGYTGNGSAIVYTYDALDRIAVRSNTTSGVNTTFTYSGASTKATATAASTGNRSYSRDPDGAVIGVKSGATTRFAGLNRHSDLRFLFDTSGAVTDTRTYDPTGNVLASSGTTGIDLGYQSEYTDPTSDQVWMAARWYNPATAAFQSRDSYNGRANNPISLNRYTYAHNNPTNLTDPSGHSPASCSRGNEATFECEQWDCPLFESYSANGWCDPWSNTTWEGVCQYTGHSGFTTGTGCIDCPILHMYENYGCRPWTPAEAEGICRLDSQYVGWLPNHGCATATDCGDGQIYAQGQYRCRGFNQDELNYFCTIGWNTNGRDYRGDYWDYDIGDCAEREAPVPPRAAPAPIPHAPPPLPPPLPRPDCSGLVTEETALACMPAQYRNLDDRSPGNGTDAQSCAVPFVNWKCGLRAEVDLCRSSVELCHAAESRVTSWAKSIPGAQDGSSRGNAIQHLAFAIGLVLLSGSVEWAADALDAHENIRGNSQYGPLTAERAMDLFNNQVGLSIGGELLAEGYGGEIICAIDVCAQGPPPWNRLRAIASERIDRAMNEGRTLWLVP